MIVDASALVAMLAGEPDAARLLERLQEANVRFTHPISIFEAALAIRRLNAIEVEIARADVEEFLDRADIAVLAVSAREASAALEGFDRYGKGRHPAALNMGDCFSYACAKLRGMPLLYKGEDFAKTDLA